MTALPSLNAGTEPTAAQWQTLLPVAAVKTVSESRSNTTTMTDDAVLRVNFTTNATYLITARIIYNSNSTSDFKFQFVETSAGGVTGSFVAIGVPLGGTAIFTSEANIGTVLIYEGQSADRSVTISGTLTVGANAGALKMQWAQNTSNASGTGVQAGSFLVIEQIA